VTPGMDAFLAPSRYCDCDHPWVATATSRAVRGARSQRAAAVRIFRFVRDEVLYMFGPWGVEASHTLQERRGTCTNKNNLLIAMLRRAGIPAAYGVLRVNPLEYFGNLTPDFLRSLRTVEPRSESSHVYAAAYLNGRWVKCDSSTDAEVSAKTAHFSRQTRLIEWDGEHDALDALDPTHIYADLGLRSTIDDMLDKPPRNALPAKLEILNDYVWFIRRQPSFPSAEALIGAWLASLSQRRASAVS
jgi:hypothetical protein